jgi:hypothetical protein
VKKLPRGHLAARFAIKLFLVADAAFSKFVDKRTQDIPVSFKIGQMTRQAPIFLQLMP